MNIAHFVPAAGLRDLRLTHKGEAYARRHERIDPGEATRLRAAIADLIRIRDEAADVAAQLIDELDRIDGGELDDEPAADDEPSLGSLDANSQARWSDGDVDDMEGDAEDDAEDCGDREPSLGSVTGLGEGVYGPCREDVGSQEGWAQGAGDDLEHEHDGSEPDVDREPSLGAANDYHGSVDQTRWDRGSHGDSDLEGDEAEAGIGDEDALALVEEERDSRAAFRHEERLTDPAKIAREMLDSQGVYAGRRWRGPDGPLSGERHVVDIGGRQVLVMGYVG